MSASLRPSESPGIPASVLVIGAGSHGRVAAELALACGFSEIAFADDGVPDAVGAISDLPDLAPRYSAAIVSLGNLPFRQELLDRLESLSCPIPSLVHPTAYVSPSARIGAGALVLPGAIVNTNAVVGKGAIISAGAIIDHDAVIGPCAHIDAGAVVAACASVPPLTKIPPAMPFFHPPPRKALPHELSLCRCTSR